MGEFFLEIGTEDLPARFIPQSIDEINKIIAKILSEEGLSFKEIVSFGTYRRIVCAVKGIDDEQKDREEVIYGPPVSIAYDKDGAPTKAANGFAKKVGANVDKLEKASTGKGEVLCLKKLIKGRRTEDILPSLCERAVSSLSFKKTMRWADCDFRFARPLRWFAALYDKSVVDFEVAGIKSSNKTYGHRFISPDEIEVSSFSDYLEKIGNAGVVLDHDKRREVLKEKIHQMASEAGGEIIESDELLEMLSFMVECPGAVAGGFNEKFLIVPEDVLSSAIQKQQFYFPVRNKSGEDKKLLNAFVAVYDKDKDVSGNIKKGNERVLRARLEDAKFFYEEDMETPFKERTEKLKSIVFMEKLGSMYEKVQRVNSLSKSLMECLITNIPESINAVACEDAALLCKNDLLTKVVQEFPELQGIMGREYLIRQGGNKITATAVFEHYLPRFANDLLPESAEGAVVALADRMDSIAGCFSKGFIPSGSEDPFGLRRAAIGIINIVEKFDFSLNLENFIGASLSLYGVDEKSKHSVCKKIINFFKVRYQGTLELKKSRMDLVNSAINARFDDFNDTTRRVDALHRLMNEPWFESLSIAFKRAMKILPEEGISGEVESSLIAEDAEKELLESVRKAETGSRPYLDSGNYFEALRRICEIRESVDRFFDEVLVMSDDLKVRENRFRILKRIVDLFSDIADFRQVSSGK